MPEVLDEILDRNLKRRLTRMGVDGGPQKRAAFLPGLDSLDYGERAVIRAMFCDKYLGQVRVYVSKDAGSQDFISNHTEQICEEVMDTSDFIIKLYKGNHVNTDYIRRVLSDNTRRVNKRCRNKLERVLDGVLSREGIE